MKAVSQTYHLNRRNGVWHYRRRVPTALAESIGKRFIQFSLGTADLKEAKKRRAAEDLKWSTQFEVAEKALASLPEGKPQSPDKPGQPLSESEVIRLVQRYVEQVDEHRHRDLTAHPMATEEERSRSPRAIIAQTTLS
jgi:hypothetical protein